MQLAPPYGFLYTMHPSTTLLPGQRQILRRPSEALTTNLYLLEKRSKKCVPQGTVLGPLLFLTFMQISLMQLNTPKPASLEMTASLHRRTKNHPDQVLLHEDLDSLETWENTWQIFDSSTCSVIHILPSQWKASLSTVHQLPTRTNARNNLSPSKPDLVAAFTICSQTLLLRGLPMNCTEF